jgi:hypothetical protein
MGQSLGEESFEIIDERASAILHEAASLPPGRILVRAYLTAEQAHSVELSIDSVTNVLVHPIEDEKE